MPNTIQDFWGKLNRDAVTGQMSWLPLRDHCIDVSAVFRALCDLPAIRRALNAAADKQLAPNQLDRLAVLALLHDIGKCNLGFQRKSDPNVRNTAGHVRELAGIFYDESETWAPRLRVALSISDFAVWFADPESFVQFLIAAISHHGEPALCRDQASMDSNSVRNLWAPDGTLDPFDGIADLAAVARRAYPDAFVIGTSPLPSRLGLQHLFSGLVMLADWLGSHRERFFPFDHEGDRIVWAKGRATAALAAVGLDVSVCRADFRDRSPRFEDLFGFRPRPL